MQLPMFSKDLFLNSLDLNIFPRQELHELQEACLVLCLIVCAVLYQALQSCKLCGLLPGAGVGAVNDGITGLKNVRGCVWCERVCCVMRVCVV